MPRPKRRTAPADARPLTDELLAAIRDSGLTDYALGQLAGVDPTALRRFRTRERDLSLACLDRLFKPLGLRLVRSAKGRPKKAQDGA